MQQVIDQVLEEEEMNQKEVVEVPLSLEEVEVDHLLDHF